MTDKLLSPRIQPAKVSLRPGMLPSFHDSPSMSFDSFQRVQIDTKAYMGKLQLLPIPERWRSMVWILFLSIFLPQIVLILFLSLWDILPKALTLHPVVRV